ncbi:MAG: hypothetical protein JXB38_00800, partial [Anaerolineales bacterium]|nr:hypothetical protein [Anaerolineales bacterium]
MKIRYLRQCFVFGLGGIILLVLWAAIPAQAAPVVHYVAPGTNCNGAQPCYADIDSAIDAAANYDEIRVAQGTYTQLGTEDGITAVVHIVDKRLTLTGGYPTTDWNTPNPAAYPTIISAQNNGIGIYVNYQAD